MSIFQLRTLNVVALVAVLSLTVCSQKPTVNENPEGVNIFFKCFGSGKNLLIINGGPGMNSEGFDALAEKLAINRRCIIYDQRGTGKSLLDKIDSSTISLQLMIEDIEQLRKILKIEKWDILGHSFGGILACQYTALHPNRVDHIILSSSAGVNLDFLDYLNESVNSKLTFSEKKSLDTLNSEILKGDTTVHTKLRRARILASAFVVNKKFITDVANRVLTLNTLVNNLVIQDLQRINYNCEKELSKFNGPALIIQGENDIIRPATAQKTHSTIKNSEISFLNNCGHYGWLDNPKDYFAKINAFLR